jgi:hypothetical protein
MNDRRFTIIIPSFRPTLAAETERSLRPLPVVHWDGTGYPSFAKLINDCIVHCGTEMVIIAADKVRPSQAHVLRVVGLLEEGYAFAGLYYFGFFGFKKELIRRVGFLDERFVGGECEDSDFILRMREAGLGYYLSKECGYVQMRSSWNNTLSRAHFVRKWGSIHMNLARRALPEESYPYDLGPSVPTTFLGSERSVERT